MIRIGDTVYLRDVPPLNVAPRIAAEMERLSFDFSVDVDTLADLIDARPGGIVRVGQKRN